MIEIDGSMGEGGGQVLRSALSASLITGTAFHIRNIRANRSRPGLGAQHLKSVDAAAAVGQAQVDGARRNSTAITFEPRAIRTGKYDFEIGTAGATSLVYQTIFVPLSLARSASSLHIHGGTHVPMAPCYEYLAGHWLSYLKHIGFDALLELHQAGFYPQGGGQIASTIRPAENIRPISLSRRGDLLSIEGVSAVANLPASIAERQKRQALRRLNAYCDAIHIKQIKLRSPGKGTFLLLRGLFAPLEDDLPPSCCYFGLGAPGKPAERVADEAVDRLLAFLASDAAIDGYLADQLLLPLAMARGESVLSTERVSNHLLTNAQVIQRFMPVEFQIRGQVGSPGSIRILPEVPVEPPG